MNADTRSSLSAHTAGPWTQDSHRVRTGRGLIAECPTPKNGGVFDCQANARLIAAAPEMLAALTHVEAVLTIVEPRSNKAEYLETLAEVRAIIAKATGSAS